MIVYVKHLVYGRGLAQKMEMIISHLFTEFESLSLPRTVPNLISIGKGKKSQLLLKVVSGILYKPL